MRVQQGRAEADGVGDGAERGLLRGFGHGAVIERGLVCQGGEGDVGLDAALVADDDATGVGQVCR